MFRGRWRPWFAVLLLFGFAEIFVRLFLGSVTYTQRDPDFRWIYKPSQSFIYSLEGYAKKQSNEMGFLDRSWMDRPPSDERILVFGDSFIEGLQVNDDESFIHRLSVLAPQRDFYSLSRSGFGPVHFLKALERWNPVIKAKSAIVFINDGDLVDLDSEVKWQFSEDRKIHSVALAPRPQEALKEFVSPLLEVSALAHFIYLRWNARWYELLSSPDKTAAQDPEKIDLTEKMEKLRFVLKSMQASVHLYLVYEPRITLESSEVRVGSPETYVLLKEMLRDFDRDFVNLFPLYQNRWKSGQWAHGFSNSTPGEGHWNVNGHRWAAEAVSERLRRTSRHQL